MRRCQTTSGALLQFGRDLGPRRTSQPKDPILGRECFNSAATWGRGEPVTILAALPGTDKLQFGRDLGPRRTIQVPAGWHWTVCRLQFGRDLGPRRTFERYCVVDEVTITASIRPRPGAAENLSS
ncbi:MAG: hypothetical protein JWO38_8235 [Gemmataceae bacterium]|nr:hypothetical protein [Gemmataceae bacterium]